MKYDTFCRHYNKKERKSWNKDDMIAKTILTELELEIDLPCGITGDYISDLLRNYFCIEDKSIKKKILLVLERYGFDYSMSIHNAIYNLLGPSENDDGYVDPLLWPGVKGINFDGNKYVLDTVLGRIEVYKASDIFMNTPSSFIFSKQLARKCFERTYDFLSKNRDYQAVVSYMPNFFDGGHYHAYLEKDGCVLDIASNAYYTSLDSAKKVLRGDVITKLSYGQVRRKFHTLANTCRRIQSESRLLTLTLYYDIKRRKKKK